MTTSQLNAARQLYHPTSKVEKKVLEMVNLFDTPLQNKRGAITITSLSFKKDFIKIGDLSVKKVERENSPSAILIHWYPIPHLSNKTDVYCSAFVLSEKELKLIYNKVKGQFRQFVLI